MKRNLLPKTLAAVTAFAAVFTPAAVLNASAETMAERNERFAAEIIEAGVDLGDITVSDNSQNYGYHIAVGNGTDFVSTENGSLSLPFLFENTGKDITFDVHIFAGGIAQKFSCGNSSAPSERKIFSVKAGQSVDTTLFVENIVLPESADESGEVSLTVILGPCPEREQSKIYGAGEPWFLPTKLILRTDEAADSKAKIARGSGSHELTDREDIRFSIGKDFMDNTRHFAITPKGSDRHYDAVLPAGEDGTVDITLNGYTTYTTDGSYRVSFFRNGKRTTFNDGCEYIDVTLEKGMMTADDITLEAAPGDYIFCVACPLDKLDMIEIHPVTSTLITVLAPEDMPEELPEDCYFYPVKLSPEQEQIHYEQLMAALREAGLLE